MSPDVITATLKTRRARQDIVDRLFAGLLSRRPARSATVLGRQHTAAA